MEQREGRGHYGAKLIIYQCPECSGFWVDGESAMAISRDSAIEVESDVSLEDISTEPREISAFCPRCETNLMEETGGRLPEGLHIDYCSSCHGFWFDKGEMMIYKSYMEEKRKKFNQHEAEKRSKRKASYSPNTTHELVLNFLNTKVSPRGFF
jgi:Zn-finger nucleic acid-binding protein